MEDLPGRESESVDAVIEDVTAGMGEYSLSLVESQSRFLPMVNVPSSSIGFIDEVECENADAVKKVVDDMLSQIEAPSDVFLVEDLPTPECDNSDGGIPCMDAMGMEELSQSLQQCQLKLPEPLQRCLINGTCVPQCKSACLFRLLQTDQSLIVSVFVEAYRLRFAARDKGSNFGCRLMSL